MRRLPLVLLVTATTLLILGPVPALADAVGAPPRDCPSGAIGQSTHYGPHCAPDRCEADATCATSDFTARPAGRTCGEASFCVHEQLNESMRGNTLVTTLVGPCAADGSCERGECQTGRYCLEPEATPAPEPTPDPTPEASPDGNGCAVGQTVGDGATGGLGLGVLGLLAGLGYRRTRRD